MKRYLPIVALLGAGGLLAWGVVHWRRAAQLPPGEPLPSAPGLPGVEPTSARSSREAAETSDRTQSPAVNYAPPSTPGPWDPSVSPKGPPVVQTTTAAEAAQARAEYMGLLAQQCTQDNDMFACAELSCRDRGGTWNAAARRCST